MKKVAILTKYYKNYNYGGMLQGYALHRTIENLGYDCDIISYDVWKNPNPVYKNILQQCKQYGFRSAFEKVLEKLISKQGYMIKGVVEERKLLFNHFMDETGANTKEYDDSNLSELNNLYDYFVSGSDQVWNPNAVRNLYLQGFVYDDSKKIAYAASIGRDRFSEHEAGVMIPYISSFSYLGIREKTGANLLKKYMNKNITTVLDPTMLLSHEDWDEIASERIVDEPYALFYFFSDSYEIRSKVEAFCKNKGLKLVLIPYAKQEFNYEDSKGDCIRLDKVGPKEFLSAIKNSDYVFTDSFHGSVFSIMFSKEFVVFERNKKGHVSMNSRLYDLLDTYGLGDRLISDYKILDSLEDIDYVSVNKILEDKKKESIIFLKNALK